MIGLFARGLHWQGALGMIVAFGLGMLLLIQSGETRHFRKESTRFERLYREGEAASARLVADVALAAERARESDRDNARRVATAQQTINRRTLDDFEARLADARLRADRMRATPAAQDRGVAGSPDLPDLSDASGRASRAAPENRLPSSDALIATEQAIQLDELIKWIRAQSAIDPNKDRPIPTD